MIPQCSIGENSKTIEINFREHYELSDEIGIDSMRLSKKRSYTKPEAAERIRESIQHCFDNTERAHFLYAAIRHKIESKKDNYLKEDIVKDFARLIRECGPAAWKFIESSYEPAGERSKRGAKSNTELQFTDEHSKIILVTAFLMRVLIPLLTEYMQVLSIRKDDELFLLAFEPCFTEADVEGINIKDKLYKIVSSRIRATRYSDQSMWSMLAYRSTDPEIVSAVFFRKIIIDILPKLEPTRGVVSYIHVTLKNLLTYQFRYNFEVTYRPQDLCEVADEKNSRLTNLERLEFHLTRLDESEAMVTESKIQDMLVSLIRDPRVNLSSKEVEYYKDNVEVNTAQTQLLFTFLAKRVGRYNALYGLRYGEYVIALVFFKKWLKLNGFNLLSKWVTCLYPEGMEEGRREIQAENFAKNLLESDVYKGLVGKKYKHIIGNLGRNNVIAKIISTIYTNPFNYLPAYEEDEDAEMEMSLETLTEEILRFIETL